MVLLAKPQENHQCGYQAQDDRPLRYFSACVITVSDVGRKVTVAFYTRESDTEVQQDLRTNTGTTGRDKHIRTREKQPSTTLDDFPVPILRFKRGIEKLQMLALFVAVADPTGELHVLSAYAVPAFSLLPVDVRIHSLEIHVHRNPICGGKTDRPDCDHSDRKISPASVLIA